MSREKNETGGNAIMLMSPRRAIYTQKWGIFFPRFYSLLGSRYLRSLVETILIYQQFNKPGTEQPSPKQELVDFWMDFLVEATKRDVSSVRFPVSWKSAKAACKTKGEKGTVLSAES